MNIGQASAVNTLLDFFLQRPTRHTDEGMAPPDEQDARDAAIQLADASHQKLMAGITADDVRRRWGSDD
jgi:hypothetical protein